MSKATYSPTLILLLVAAVIQISVGINYNSITQILGYGAIILGIANFFKMGLSGDSDEKAQKYIPLLTLGVGALLVFGFSFAGNVGNVQLPTGSVVPTNEAPSQASTIGQVATAKMTFTSTTGASTVYIVDPSSVSTPYDLMELAAKGTLEKLYAPGTTVPASAMTQSGNTYTKTITAKIGTTYKMAMYQDATPAAAENQSDVLDVVFTGITGGSTPEWQWHFADGSQDHQWNKYATLAFYDQGDNAKTGYLSVSASAAQKNFAVDMFPTNNNEGWRDAVLYIESPSANAGAITHIKITSLLTGKSVEATSIGTNTENLNPQDGKFLAAPSLTTTTDKMYYAIAFPSDDVRTSSNQKAKMHIELTFDHPGSNLSMYLKVVSLAGAHTVTGGHFDSPATNMNLSMYTTGTEAFS